MNLYSTLPSSWFHPCPILESSPPRVGSSLVQNAAPLNWLVICYNFPMGNPVLGESLGNIYEYLSFLWGFRKLRVSENLDPSPPYGLNMFKL